MKSFYVTIIVVVLKRTAKKILLYLDTIVLYMVILVNHIVKNDPNGVLFSVIV